MENNAYLYTGQPICPKFTLNIGGRELHRDTDYDVEITDNVNVGTAHVVIRGKGKFKGVIERTFEIRPVPARSLLFYADNTEFDYTGEPCQMRIVIKFGEIVLTENEDYTVEYTNNIEPGTAQATLHFMGNYEGTMNIPFAIFRPQKETVETSAERVSAAVPALENLSVLSADTVALGESIEVQAAAEGGVPPYMYSVRFRKVKGQNWVTVQDYAEETHIRITPARATRYIVSVKVKDSRGIIAKQSLKFTVTEETSGVPPLCT